MAKVQTPPVWLREAKQQVDRAEEAGPHTPVQPLGSPIVAPVDGYTVDEARARAVRIGASSIAHGLGLLFSRTEVEGPRRLFAVAGELAHAAAQMLHVGVPLKDRLTAASEALTETRKTLRMLFDVVTGQLTVEAPPYGRLLPATVHPVGDRQTSKGLLEVSLREMFADKPWHATRLLGDYYGAFEKTFADKSEIEPQSVLRGYLTDPETNWDITVLVDPKSGKVQGGAHTQVMPETPVGPVGVIEHIWIDKKARNGGQGRELVSSVAQTMKAAGAKGVFIEVNDPESADWSAKSRALDEKGAGIDGYQRLAFWDSLGFKQLSGLRYIQMPLEGWKTPAQERAGQVPYLMPMFLPLTSDASRTLTRDQALGVAQAYFETFDSASALPVESVRDTETFKTMANMTSSWVTLQSLRDDPRYADGLRDAQERRQEAKAGLAS